MKAKALEVRDDGTFIAILAVDMNPVEPYAKTGHHTFTEHELKADVEASAAQRYLLRRCGYPCDGRPNVVITHMSADGMPACNDPHYWPGRTFPVAHQYIIEHWADLKDGDVVDVQFILGETKAPKVSERSV